MAPAYCRYLIGATSELLLGQREQQLVAVPQRDRDASRFVTVTWSVASLATVRGQSRREWSAQVGVGAVLDARAVGRGQRLERVGRDPQHLAAGQVRDLGQPLRRGLLARASSANASGVPASAL